MDNVMIRLRGEKLIVSSVVSPFERAYWPNVREVLSEIGLPYKNGSTLETPRSQEDFLLALAKWPGMLAFSPTKIGFKWRANEVRSREQLRNTQCLVTFLGDCSRAVLLGTLEVVGRRFPENRRLDVLIKGSDPLNNWRAGKECLDDVLNHLYFRRHQQGSLMFFSRLLSVPEGLWDYIYERRCLRLGWVAEELAGCDDLAQFERYRAGSLPFKNLEELANTGIWPHIVLPASKANIGILPELVFGLAEMTRGGTIEIIPAPMLLPKLEAVPPPVGEYVAAILAIYKDARIPLRTVGPQSWVASRIDAEIALASSSEAAGASLAALPNGDIYASEAAIGLDDWYLGNVLKDGDSLRWEILDSMAEVFSTSMKPVECQSCDWRYRCGGMDSSVMLLQERPGPSVGTADLNQLYCEARKALFEESLWDSTINSAKGNAKQGREWLVCDKAGIQYQSASHPNGKQNL
jgi:radical SAM protein with 4Fe4S-binding SPASM domain